MDRPVFSGITGCGFGKIGQLQHLDTLGKGQPGMVNLFLHPAGHPQADHFNAIFTRLYHSQFLYETQFIQMG
jgi:hypothetical protein